MTQKPRARDLGIPFDGQPGPLNAITDVAGLEVGYTTLIQGDRVRTGVTAILPQGKGDPYTRLAGGYSSLNGNGEMTGCHWLEESGMLEGPVVLTNTHSVGVARDAAVAWLVAHSTEPLSGFDHSLPVVAETWDGRLNDICGQHVTPAHVFAALDNARSGPVAEGNVGSGTGMVTHQWKGGMGTASRQVNVAGHDYTVGVLVQSNYGERWQMTIAGVPVGRAMTHSLPKVATETDGSIVVVIATDAPLLPHQCKRLARRAGMGLARLGSVAADSSGDIFLAFSTARPEVKDGLQHWQSIPFGGAITPLLQAAVEATEEAIVNALVAAETMHGYLGSVVHALPHDELQAVLRAAGRLIEP